MDNDILDIEVPCYICKDLVMLGNDYRCHLNYAHDIDTKNLDCENDLNKAFQCEICGEAFKGRDVIEAHIDGLHLDIVEELEEDIADFYVHLQAVSTQSEQEPSTTGEHNLDESVRKPGDHVNKEVGQKRKRSAKDKHKTGFSKSVKGRVAGPDSADGVSS